VPKAFSLPFRQVHLDFHTGPAIPDVGAAFDAREFARTMKHAHVNSVTVFAKCHHGHLYYNTRRPERHPGLRRGLDLLGRQVEALHREGIRAPIYISVQCDEYAANAHPEWVARNADTSQVKWGKSVFTPGWQILDMSSPYQDYVAEQIGEVLRLFKPVDGIFLDMCWDQPSCAKWAIDGIRRAGLNPEAEADRVAYARQVSAGYMKRYHRMIKASSRAATVYFNSRPLADLPRDVAFQTQVEIEALPTGGWGYMYFPKNVRYARGFGRPYLGMTARFHKSWADFGGLKPYAALEYETSQMMAHGAACSIGDQLHPRGVLDRAAYERIGKAYERVAQREAWLVGAKPLAQIGVVRVGASGEYFGKGGAEEGAVRMLTQLKHQFDLLDATAPLEKYDLLILPDEVGLDGPAVQRIGTYLRDGGSVLASGLSGLNAEGTKVLLPELGIKAQGPSPYQVTYIRFGKEIGTDVPPTDHVMYEKGLRVTPAHGATVLARVVEPYFDRTWDHFSSHNQTPGDRVSRYAAAVRKGRVAYVPFPIFGAFGKHGNQAYRLLVRNILDLLLPEPLLRVEAPTSTEASITRQGRRSIIHLLQYCPERRGENLDLVEDIVPLYNVPLSLKMPRQPRRVYVAPQETPLEFTYAAGRARVTVPELAGHAMIVFE
jgi:hypothetical protein